MNFSNASAARSQEAAPTEHRDVRASSERVRRIHRDVPAWYLENARDLPWRSPERTPWEVMVSEFMLQQTPVVRVLPQWRRWMQLWPTPSALAKATTGDAVREWGRLGYPRRALRLHAAAVAIVERHEGEVPADHDELLALPGVGAYTAAAISVFAFGQHRTVIDTNIRRVHARAISGKGLPAPSLTAAETRLAQALMPEDRQESVVWNTAVMELGALVCTAKSPKCDVCPVLDDCAWVAAGRPEPDHVSRGQSWKGTDRQVRGAIMAVLRDSDAPVPRRELLGGGTGSEEPDSAPMTTLRGLGASTEQLERCLDGLLHDGLASEDAHAGVGLPG